jgi:hypothetical protein
MSVSPTLVANLNPDVITNFDIMDIFSDLDRNASTFMTADKIRFSIQWPITYISRLPFMQYLSTREDRYDRPPYT